ncbi:MAG: class I SAM-dependent methyltransferase [Eubacteriales bacterium]|nr:class I SAM-dependent methyltransferase [Eubacteriales bacterium]
MQLSKRLQALANLVSQDHVLADVGCDHGYIPIFLIQNHRIPKAIAMDIGEGPLQRAQENIRSYGLEGYIETRLSDGLAKLNPGEADTILISGMGGPLMEKIITEGKSVAEQADEMILQPQSDIPRFRKFLTEMGYVIMQENMIEEDGKYYPMMKAVRGNAQPCSELEYRYGPVLLRQCHPVLKQYLERERDNLQLIVDNLRKQSGESVQKRLLELEQEQQISREALDSYECKKDY